ncbi:peptidylprolyl isomerase [Paenibacillus guangzhouensis]|uniref:peptidylprolyl isomerase n=1 Tax=Paenibacillus guangzhouensis TaxID=1473112 RepID=UPI001266D247|nr:peptidylprolyl isomerase [Paenibacillus guangzhouensis]
MENKEKKNLTEEEVAASGSSEGSENTSAHEEAEVVAGQAHPEVEQIEGQQQEQALESDENLVQPSEVQDEEFTSEQVAASASPTEHQAIAAAPVSPRKNMTPVWMVISAVLLIGLVFVTLKPPLDKGKSVVASVNGADITKDQLYDAMLEAGGTSTVNSLIMYEVVGQEAKKEKITVSEADIDKEVENIKKSYGSEEGFNQMLTQYNLTLEALRKEMVPQVQLTKLLTPKVSVTDQEVKDYYEANKASMSTPEQVRASHILVKTKEEADAIEKELKGGADFATLAKEKSTDTGSKANGGDLNFFGKGQMVPEFEEAAFKLKVGEISEPVKSDYGYHIIKVTEKKEAINPTLDDKKVEIKEQLTKQKISEMSSEYIQGLRDKAKITNTLDKMAKKDPAATPAK